MPRSVQLCLLLVVAQLLSAASAQSGVTDPDADPTAAAAPGPQFSLTDQMLDANFTAAQLMAFVPVLQNGVAVSGRVGQVA